MLDFLRADIRVGQITKAMLQSDYYTFVISTTTEVYLEVHVGDDRKATLTAAVDRTYCKGLVGKKCLVVCNLKPILSAGVSFSGVLLMASKISRPQPELVQPPDDTIPGERVGLKVQHASRLPDLVLEKTVWEKVVVDLKTNRDGIAMYRNIPLVTSKGVCRANYADADC